MQVRIKADALDRQRQEAEKSCAAIEKELADCHRQREDERVAIPLEADIKTLETRIIENDEAASSIQNTLEVQKAALQQMQMQGETTARRLYALKQDIALRAAEHSRLITRRDALNSQLQKAEERQKEATAAVLSEARQQDLETHLEEARKRVSALRLEEATLGQAWRDAATRSRCSASRMTRHSSKGRFYNGRGKAQRAPCNPSPARCAMLFKSALRMRRSALVKTGWRTPRLKLARPGNIAIRRRKTSRSCGRHARLYKKNCA